MTKQTKERLKKTISATYELNGLSEAISEVLKHNDSNGFHSQVAFEMCKACDSSMPSIDHECLICGQETSVIKEPKFYQTVLKPIKDVIKHVYPQGGITLEERMPNNATCPDCGDNKWWLLPTESVAVKQGGKAYCECLNCGLTTHL